MGQDAARFLSQVEHWGDGSELAARQGSNPEDLTKTRERDEGGQGGLRRDRDRGGEMLVIGMWTGDSIGVGDVSAFRLIHITDGPGGCSPGGGTRLSDWARKQAGMEGQEGLAGMFLSPVWDLPPVIGILFKRKVPNLGVKNCVYHTLQHLTVLLEQFTWDSFWNLPLKSKTSWICNKELRPRGSHYLESDLQKYIIFVKNASSNKIQQGYSKLVSSSSLP